MWLPVALATGKKVFQARSQKVKTFIFFSFFEKKVFVIFVVEGTVSQP
jgi:hypothetical protein